MSTVQLRRRHFLASVAAAACARVSAQQPAERPRIVVLHPASVAESAIYQRLVPGLAQLGHVDGKYELVINDATARDLDLKLPRDLLLRADEVIR